MDLNQQSILTAVSDRTQETIAAKPLSPLTARATDQFLRINECGFQKTTVPQWSIRRDNGWLDYQLIYTWNGIGHFFIAEREIILEAGSVLIYKPHEPQFYNYYAEDKNENFWIHFTGHAVPEILRACGFWDTNIFMVGKSTALADAFDKIIQTMLSKHFLYEYEAIGHFFTLLSMLAQHQKRQANQQIPPDLQKLFPVINLMNNDYSKNLTIKDYADICHLSPSRFTHLFTQSLGVSPNRYKHEVRSKHAKDMLVHTNLSIREISAALGYENPLYFSRRFKQFVGCSPQSYRSKHKK